MLSTYLVDIAFLPKPDRGIAVFSNGCEHRSVVWWFFFGVGLMVPASAT
jgi:hypothetical protein